MFLLRRLIGFSLSLCFGPEFLRKNFHTTKHLNSVLWHSDTAWKESKYGVIPGPYFPVLGLNHACCTQKIRPKTDKLEIFEFDKENKDKNTKNLWS